VGELSPSAHLDKPFPPGRYPLIVVGSGPGGLQLSYSLSRLGIGHAVLSEDSAPGGMFRRWPVFQRMLSWTKPYTGLQRSSRAYERFDWNSLLADDERQRAVMMKHLPIQMQAMATAYAREFSLAELKEIHAFAATPAGSHYLSQSLAIIGDPAVAKANTDEIAEIQTATQDLIPAFKEKAIAYLKAHPDVANLLLQILEDGTLTDAYGNQVDFKNTLVLMTSNIGSKLVLRGGRMGFGEGSQEASFQRIEEEILAELRRTFSPEFINRIDEVIVFNPLGDRDLRSIVDILLEDVNNTLSERNLRLEVSDRAKEWLLAKADIEPSTGARPLRRTIQRHIQDAVSEILINQHGETIERIEVDLEGGELTFHAGAQEIVIPRR